MFYFFHHCTAQTKTGIIE